MIARQTLFSTLGTFGRKQMATDFMVINVGAHMTLKIAKTVSKQNLCKKKIDYLFKRYTELYGAPSGGPNQQSFGYNFVCLGAGIKCFIIIHFA